MRDPVFRKTGVNLFISHLPQNLDNKALIDIFSVFGPILSSKIVYDENQKSRGYGYVHFSNEEDAIKAISRLNGATIEDHEIKVEKFCSKVDRPTPDVWTNLYVKQFPLTWKKEDLEKLFAPYGTVQSVYIETDETGASKGHGYVNFETNESAKKAIAALHDSPIPGEEKKLYVDRHQKKDERKRMLKAKNEADKNELNKKYQNMNLYVKNIAEDVTDEEFHETFSAFGQITSSRIMREADKSSKGFGFVCYTNVDDATNAIREMNGKNYHGKLLVVTLYQRKELRASFNAAKNSPLNKYYNQAMFAPMVQQKLPIGYGYPAPRPFRQPQQNMQMPYMKIPMNRNPGSVPFIRQQMPMAVPHQKVPYPKPANYRGQIGISQPPTPAPLNTSSIEFSKALLNQEPAMQKRMIGERLYPLISVINANLAPKITGMLLEMDNTELLNLIESPDALSAKVQEALNVLKINNLG